MSAITDDDEETITSVARFCRWKHLGDHRNTPPVDCRPIRATTREETRVQWDKPDEPTAFCVYTTTTAGSRHVVYSGAADGEAHAKLIASVLTCTQPRGQACSRREQKFTEEPNRSNCALVIPTMHDSHEPTCTPMRT